MTYRGNIFTPLHTPDQSLRSLVSKLRDSSSGKRGFPSVPTKFGDGISRLFR